LYLLCCAASGIAGAHMSFWQSFFNGPVEWGRVVAAVIPTLIIAWLGARLAKRAAATAIRRLLQDTVVMSSPLVRGPLRLVSIGTFALLVAVVLFPAFEVVGLQPRAGLPLHTIATWTFESGLKVLLIVVLSYALVRTVGLVVSRFEHELNRGTGLDALERAKRARTLGSVITKVATALIVGIAVLMILREFRIDIAPVLTGAGIVGLAVGFGAQTLVRDIISGFFLILEDQVRVGDVAAINGIGGLVEELNLRTIVLRDVEGTVHVFPNGSITTLANRSKDFSYYVIDLPISYQEDPDRITAILRQIGAGMQNDVSYGPFILDPIEILGVDAFGLWSLQLKVRIKTVPLKQWEVGRELRKRIKKAFAELGIDMTFPERVVSVKAEKSDAAAS
jgi:small conductance mechanosensitive channel